MLWKLTSQGKRLFDWYESRVCKAEFARQRFTRFNERPVEFSFVFRKLAEIYPRTVLDVGTGTTALPHLIGNCGSVVTATDNIRDYWPSGMSNRHFYVQDDDICNTSLPGRFDLITCISVLEHIKHFDAAVRNMFALLSPDGHLILTFPYTEDRYVPNVYDLPGSSYGQDLPYVAQSFSRHEVARWLLENRAAIHEQEYWKFWDGDCWTVGNQLIPPKRVASSDGHQLTCIHLRKGGA